MLPTMNTHGDIVLIENMTSTIEPGDVVVCISPSNPKQKLCKRVIGKPGDIIYRTEGFWTTKLIVSPGHYWLQGDNLDNSTDSRTYGPVPQALICGKVFLKVYPFTQFGLIERTMQYAGQPHLGERMKSYVHTLIPQLNETISTPLTVTDIKALLPVDETPVPGLKPEEEEEAVISTATIHPAE